MPITNGSASTISDHVCAMLSSPHAIRLRSCNHSPKSAHTVQSSQVVHHHQGYELAACIQTPTIFAVLLEVCRRRSVRWRTSSFLVRHTCTQLSRSSRKAASAPQRTMIVLALT